MFFFWCAMCSIKRSTKPPPYLPLGRCGPLGFLGPALLALPPPLAPPRLPPRAAASAAAGPRGTALVETATESRVESSTCFSCSFNFLVKPQVCLVRLMESSTAAGILLLGCVGVVV